MAVLANLVNLMSTEIYSLECAVVSSAGPSTH